MKRMFLPHEKKVNVPAGDDTVPETHMAMETPFFGWYLLGKIGIFHCYVTFREMVDFPICC